MYDMDPQSDVWAPDCVAVKGFVGDGVEQGGRTPRQGARIRRGEGGAAREYCCCEVAPPVDIALSKHEKYTVTISCRCSSDCHCHL